MRRKVSVIQSLKGFKKRYLANCSQKIGRLHVHLPGVLVTQLSLEFVPFNIWSMSNLNSRALDTSMAALSQVSLLCLKDHYALGAICPCRVFRSRPLWLWKQTTAWLINIFFWKWYMNECATHFPLTSGTSWKFTKTTSLEVGACLRRADVTTSCLFTLRLCLGILTKVTPRATFLSRH